MIDTYDLDDPAPRVPAAAPRRTGPSRRRLAIAAVLVLLLLVVTAGLTGIDQRSRNRKSDALLALVTQGQATVRYSDSRVQALVQYTSPTLLSARAPERVRASLRQVVQQGAAGQLAPLRARRDAVARLEVTHRHGDLRRARAAYLTYLDQRISYLQAVSLDLRTLYRPQPANRQLLVAARDALLAVDSDAASTARIRELLP